jgi:hypothetical protein
MPYRVANRDSPGIFPLLSISAIQEYIGLLSSQELHVVGLFPLEHTLLSSTNSCLVTP